MANEISVETLATKYKKFQCVELRSKFRPERLYELANKFDEYHVIFKLFQMYSH